MTKTKFNIQLHRLGLHTEDICKMIANKNSGKINLDLEVVCGYIMGMNAKYPAQKHSLKHEGANDQILHISDEEGVYITLEEIEIKEIEYNRGVFTNDIHRNNPLKAAPLIDKANKEIQNITNTIINSISKRLSKQASHKCFYFARQEGNVFKVFDIATNENLVTCGDLTSAIQKAAELNQEQNKSYKKI